MLMLFLSNKGKNVLGKKDQKKSIIKFIEVKFNITTTDILHAPFIPEYGVKEDAVPIVNTYLYFTPMENGTFIMYCTEYCGDGHSVMLSDVHVVDDPNDNYACNNV